MWWLNADFVWLILPPGGMAGIPVLPFPFGGHWSVGSN